MDNWYALQVITGREKDVAQALNRRGIQAVAPSVERLERKDGKWEPVSRMAIPGYVFIKCVMTVQLYYHLTGKAHIVRLVGQSGANFTCIPPDQMGWIARLHMSSGRGAVSKGVKTDGGIEIVDGPLTELKDRIVRIDERGRRATVEIKLYDESYQIDMALDVVKTDKQPDGSGG